MIEAIVTDIEGTTTPVTFVKEVLFPYSRARLADFVRTHASDPEIAALLDRVRGDTRGGSDDEVVALLVRYIDEDRKDTVLKELQGRIWRTGYLDGDFVAPIYPDAAAELRRWKEAGISLYVFSSGSVEAQRLLFAHTDAGDITPLFSGWFDTNIGKKTDGAAYRAIVAAIGRRPDEVAFLSDTPAELDAASGAGLAAFGVARAGLPGQGHHRWVTRFDELHFRVPPRPASA